MGSKWQPKQKLDSGTIFMRGRVSVLHCPGLLGTFLITIQSLSVYTPAGAE